MYKKTLIVGCVICFVLGFFVVYVGQTPLNPDVRATVKALQIGMTKEEAIRNIRMSFLLKESMVVDSNGNANDSNNVVSTVSGVMPGRAYRYFLKAGFSQNGRLVSLDYYSRKGWLWLFHSNLSPHVWQGDQ